MPTESTEFDNDGNPLYIRVTSDDGRESTKYKYDKSYVADLVGDHKGEPVEIADHHKDGTTTAYDWQGGPNGFFNGNRGSEKGSDSGGSGLLFGGGSSSSKSSSDEDESPSVTPSSSSSDSDDKSSWTADDWERYEKAGEIFLLPFYFTKLAITGPFLAAGWIAGKAIEWKTGKKPSEFTRYTVGGAALVAGLLSIGPISELYNKLHPRPPVQQQSQPAVQQQNNYPQNQGVINNPLNYFSNQQNNDGGYVHGESNPPQQSNNQDTIDGIVNMIVRDYNGLEYTVNSSDRGFIENYLNRGDLVSATIYDSEGRIISRTNLHELLEKYISTGRVDSEELVDGMVTITVRKYNGSESYVTSNNRRILEDYLNKGEFVSGRICDHNGKWISTTFQPKMIEDYLSTGKVIQNNLSTRRVDEYISTGRITEE